MSKSTRLPWLYDASCKYYRKPVIRMRGVVVCEMNSSKLASPSAEEMSENANLIVTAVNSHADLLATAKAFIEDFNAYINSDDYDLPDPCDLLKAIAKAEGTP